MPSLFVYQFFYPMIKAHAPRHLLSSSAAMSMSATVLVGIWENYGALNLASI